MAAVPAAVAVKTPALLTVPAVADHETVCETAPVPVTIAEHALVEPMGTVVGAHVTVTPVTVAGVED